MGFLNINKPSGPTSHDIITQVRHKTKIRQVGHAGTLDPLADGVLVVGIGYATRLIEYLNDDRKLYLAVAELGYTTDTYDRLGKTIRKHDVDPRITRETLMGTLTPFIGTISQVPPLFSALRVNGKRAYELARRGVEVELEPRLVTIFQLSVNEVELPKFVLEVECSSGTYVRSLVHDIGVHLGCGATLVELTRLKSGYFKLEDSICVDDLTSLESGDWSKYLIHPGKALSSMQMVELPSNELQLLSHGQPIQLRGRLGGTLLVIDSSGRPRAVLKQDSGAMSWRPIKVFPLDSGS